MRTLLATLALAALMPAAAAAQTLSAEEVKRLALEAILENPEIIMQAVELLQNREEQARLEAGRAMAEALSFELEEDPNAPVLGNPEGDVTLVEFFDYNCPYCMRTAEDVHALIEGDGGLRVVFREWPILGEGSLYAARAALAAREQGGYEAMHWALMADRSRKDEAAVLRIAAEVGLDVERLKADMESEAVENHIAQSLELARALGFNGTPSFVIGAVPVPGAVPLDALQGYVADARAE